MKHLKYLILSLLILITLSSWAIDLDKDKIDLNSENPKKMISMLQEHFNKVFINYSYPLDLIAGSDGNFVLLDYGPVSFKVKKKVVTMVVFWNTYIGEIDGAKIGMTKNELINLWGDPVQEKVSSTGNLWLIWKKGPVYYQTIFDEEGKVKRFQFEVIS